MPESYRAPPSAAAQQKNRTVSQSISTNISKDTGTVGKILAQKGGKIFSISRTDTISEAVKILRERRIGALMVTEANGTLCGILSERDIVRKLAETPGQTLPQTVEENMTKDVKTCTSEDTLVSVLRVMTEGHFRHMPIVDGGKLEGMLTIGDVIQYRLNELEHESLQLKQMVVG
ncbi:MAG: CBS domain-containing protein [Pseudomonadota bacterium]